MIFLAHKELLITLCFGILNEASFNLKRFLFLTENVIKCIPR